MKQIKTFLLLTVLLAFGMVSMGSAMADGHGSIVDVAAENGSFTTLLAAAEAAGLADMLDQNGPFTVLAPTDEAFAALPEGTVEALLEDTGTLRQILLYHVIQGTVPAADVVTLSSATTALGKEIAIEVVDGGVVINGTANVVLTDVGATNGLIHVIDSVLLPPAGWGPATAAPADDDMGDMDAGDGDDGDMEEGSMDDMGDAGNEDTPAMTGDAADLLANMKKVRMIIEQMGGLLDRLYAGETQSCTEYLGYYQGLEMSPVLEGLSPELDAFQAVYMAAIAKVKDTNNNIKLICEDGGGSPSGLARDVARTGINEALNMLIPAIEALEPMVGMMPEAPAEPMPEEMPAEEMPAEEMPAEEMPAEEMPAEEMPAEEMPAEEMPAEEKPAEEMPADMPEDTSDLPANQTAADLLNHMEILQSLLGAMGWELDQMNSGTDVCAAYMANYEKLQMAPVMAGIAPDLEALQAIFVAAVDKALTTNQAVYETCQNGGTLSSLNYGVARIGINEALDMLNPAIEATAPLVDVAPAPMPDMPADMPDEAPADMPEEMPAEEAKEEAAPEPAPAAPLGNDPLDTNDDGIVSDEEFEAALNGVIDRINSYLENGPLAFNGENLYIDMLLIHDQMAGAVVTLIETSDCDLYALAILPVFVAPEYKDVPAEWQNVYNQYRDAISLYGDANEQAVRECEENGAVSDDALSAAFSGTIEAQTMVQSSLAEGASLLNVPAPTFINVEIQVSFAASYSLPSLSTWR